MSAKLTALPDITTPALTDLMYLVRPSSGAAGSKSVLISELQTLLLAGVPRALPPMQNVVGNVGSTQTILHAYSLNNQLKKDGDYILFDCSGQIALNSNAKLIDMIIGTPGSGSHVILEGPLSIVGAVNFAGVPMGWRINGKIVRFSNQTVTCTASLIFGMSQIDSSGAVSSSLGNMIVNRNIRTNEPSVPPLFQIIIVAQGVADNDITQNLTTIEVVNF